MNRETPLVATWAVAASLALSAPSLAQPDFAAGRAVVVGGEESTVTPCFLCHGLDGAGDSAGAFPRLTQQVPFYMYKQLVDYASGERENEVMSPIARAMTEPQMENVSYYYSRVSAPYLSRPEPEPEVLARGRKIAEDGLPEAGVQACNICHGREGGGNPPLFPYLAGQYALYTELQLRLFRQGARHNDPLGVMREIAEGLSDEDILALALYYEWVRPDAEEEPAQETRPDAPDAGALSG